MTAHVLKIEIFSAPSCTRCDKAFQMAKHVLTELAQESSEYDSIELRKLSVVDELDYAVDLGVRATPSIAMNGVLVFTVMPSAAAFRNAVLSRVSPDNQASS